MHVLTAPDPAIMAVYNICVENGLKEKNFLEISVICS
jgi:hypothetical protein